uniref:Activin_recp domain-containing protein n=1 Tax=Elaeophora elaphi TaxID=1147741 RepID=A0A0R3RWX0_9BILA
MHLSIFLVAVIIATANSLQCIYGGYGVVNERSGTIRETDVTCKSQTRFCLTLESDTTVNGDHVKGFARGCDQEMPGSSKHEFCKLEGCMRKSDSRGITKVCCCTGDFCNGGSRTNFIITISFVSFIFVYFFSSNIN